MITVTEKAADRVKQFVDEDPTLGGQGIRVKVLGGGCAGFTHDLYFEDQVGDMDELFESHGVKLYVDPLSLQYVDGAEIDFVETAHGGGFKISNPNVKGSCGCGSSVSF